jgi:hypothetical protein
MSTAVECTRLDVAETERDRNKYDIAITLAAAVGVRQKSNKFLWCMTRELLDGRIIPALQ